MSPTAGKGVIVASGKLGLVSGGDAAIFDAAGECVACCGHTFDFSGAGAALDYGGVEDDFEAYEWGGLSYEPISPWPTPLSWSTLYNDAWSAVNDGADDPNTAPSVDIGWRVLFEHSGPEGSGGVLTQHVQAVSFYGQGYWIAFDTSTLNGETVTAAEIQLTYTVSGIADWGASIAVEARVLSPGWSAGGLDTLKGLGTQRDSWSASADGAGLTRIITLQAGDINTAVGGETSICLVPTYTKPTMPTPPTVEAGETESLAYNAGIETFEAVLAVTVA